MRGACSHGEGHIWPQSILGKLKSPATQILQLSLWALDSEFGNSSHLCWSCSWGLRDNASCLAARSTLVMIVANNEKSGFKSYRPLVGPIETQGSCTSVATKSRGAHVCYSSYICGHSTTVSSCIYIYSINEYTVPYCRCDIRWMYDTWLWKRSSLRSLHLFIRVSNNFHPRRHCCVLM